MNSKLMPSLVLVGTLFVRWQLCAAQPVFVDAFASLPSPMDVAVSPDGLVYVADLSQVHIFRPDGSLLTTFPNAIGAAGIDISPDGAFVFVTGILGTVRFPTLSSSGTTVAISSGTDVAVGLTHVFQVFGGTSVAKIPRLGVPAGTTSFPTSSVVRDLALSETLYTHGNGVLARWDLNGTLIRSINFGSARSGLDATEAGFVYLTPLDGTLHRFNENLDPASQVALSLSGIQGWNVAVGPEGYVYVADASAGVIHRYFDPEAWQENSELKITDSITVSSPIIVPAGATIARDGTGNGALHAEISAPRTSRIRVDGGSLILGSTASMAGFATDGDISIESSGTLQLDSRGKAKLGRLTNLGSGGQLVAPNGIALPSGSILTATAGQVQGRMAADAGSTVFVGGGSLSLGDANAVDGFFSDGELIADAASDVSIYDRNEAVLGSLTRLGDGTNGANLIAGAALPAHTHAHFLLEEGKNLVGRGTVAGNFRSHGSVVGDGVMPDERIVFDAGWKVTGIGWFENVLFNGTFAPGLSPGITTGTNQAFAGAIEIELGGLTPGIGAGHHDQIQDRANIALVGDPELRILPYASFQPQVGDEFEIMTWQGGLTGRFGKLAIDPWFSSHGLAFALDHGANRLTLRAVAVPESSTAILALLATLGLGRLRPRHVWQKALR